MNDALLSYEAEVFYDRASCGYISSLTNGTIVRANLTFCRWLGYEREDVIGRRVHDFLTVGAKIFYETHYRPLLDMQGAVQEIAVDFVRSDGELLPTLVNSVQEPATAQSTAVIRTIVFNATERRRYERELLFERRRAEEASKAKSDLIAMISHDVRNPLAAVLSGLGLLDKTELTPQQKRYVRLLKITAHNLQLLTDNTLELSKIEAGGLRLHNAGFNLRELVYRTVEGMLPAAEEKGLELSIEIDEAVPEIVIGDAVKIGQVLMNLLSNSLKFTDKGSIKVRLACQAFAPADVLITFSVIDTGKGIPSEHLGQVSDEYFQVESSARQGGTGLGLAICRNILELYGSRIVIESTVGSGSQFSFSLRLPRGAE